MHDAVTPEKTQVQIPYAVIEYTAVFKRPILEAWADSASLIAAILDSLAPFGFTIDGVEQKVQHEKVSEHAFVFRRGSGGLTFALHLGKVVINAENLDWSEAEQFITGARAGIGAILERAKAQIQSQVLVLLMHLQLKVRERQEVTAPLLSKAGLGLLEGDLKLAGVILQRGKATIVVDASAGFANGLFVKVTREHAGDVTFEQIAAILRADEIRLFETLGFEGEL
jgi:hypothetical protein